MWKYSTLSCMCELLRPGMVLEYTDTYHSVSMHCKEKYGNPTFIGWMHASCQDSCSKYIDRTAKIIGSTGVTSSISIVLLLDCRSCKYYVED